LLRVGDFGSVTTSPDGATLVVVALMTASRYLGGRLLLIDTSGNILDTLTSPRDTILCSRFGKSSGTLYYYAIDRGIFKMDLGSGHVDTLLSIGLDYRQSFDILDDTLVLLPARVYHLPSKKVDTLPVGPWQPRACLFDEKLVSGVVEAADDHSYLGDMVLVDRDDKSVTHLDARPFAQCDIVEPSWSPDGKYIATATAKLIPGGFLDPTPMVGRYDIWKLRVASP
jgi:hypothetical protein